MRGDQFLSDAPTRTTLRGAKSAAEEAREAAIQTKTRLFNIDAIGELSTAIGILQEIIRLQNMQAWERAIDRFHCEPLWAARHWEDPPLSAADAFLNCNTPRDVELLSFRLAFRLGRAANGGWPDRAARRSMP